jgi:hypothetical protein
MHDGMMSGNCAEWLWVALFGGDQMDSTWLVLGTAVRVKFWAAQCTRRELLQQQLQHEVWLQGSH